MKKILRNRAKCKACGAVIESTYRHHFVSCNCPKKTWHKRGIFVDGGHDYLRRGGNLDNFIDLYEVKDE